MPASGAEVLEWRMARVRAITRIVADRPAFILNSGRPDLPPVPAPFFAIVSLFDIESPPTKTREDSSGG
jgi:hypothetical protein